MPRQKKDCKVCTKPFQPRSEARYFPHELCGECRKVQAGAEEDKRFVCVDERTGEVVKVRATDSVSFDWKEKNDFVNPAAPAPREELHRLAAPMRQCVFDLETWGLDRGWGVTMVASMLVHGDGPEPRWFNFTLRESSTWPQKRSDDRELVEKIVSVLNQCDIVYAHNGENFDIKWLRTACLKYGLDLPHRKLVDPCKAAWRKYRLPSNSLSMLAQFLELDEQKMPVSTEVWRRALLDDSNEDWKTLAERCQSDVRVLNAVAARVTKDVGMVDFGGSWR